MSCHSDGCIQMKPRKFEKESTTGQSSWLGITYLVVFGSLLTYPAYVFGISKLPATQVSVYVYTNPLVAVLPG
ncbi:MAG: EamA family transporter [Bacteroidota bacterium]